MKVLTKIAAQGCVRERELGFAQLVLCVYPKCEHAHTLLCQKHFCSCFRLFIEFTCII